MEHQKEQCRVQLIFTIHEAPSYRRLLEACHKFCETKLSLENKVTKK